MIEKQLKRYLTCLYNKLPLLKRKIKIIDSKNHWDFQKKAIFAVQKKVIINYH